MRYKICKILVTGFVLLIGLLLFNIPLYGDVIIVSTVTELQDSVGNITSGDTIMVEDGIYELTNTLVFDGGIQDVALIGNSGNRDSVIIKGKGMDNPNYGNVPHIIMLRNVSNAYIANLTLEDVYYHPIIIQAEQNAFSPHMNNLHIIDAGEQFVKVTSGGSAGPYCDYGILENSCLEYTDRARSWYTNGIDCLAVLGWIVRDNEFIRIRAPVGQLAGAAILFWQNSLETIVERNKLVECDMGISFGNPSGPGPNARNGETVYDHQEGIIRNNFIFRNGDGDVGITLNKANNFKVYNNTVVLNGTFYWNIEYRFIPSTGDIYYNLVDGDIISRDGASADSIGNITSVDSSWFVDIVNGDLHLTEAATPVIDQADYVSEVPDDIDEDIRPIGISSDIGADEYNSGGVLEVRHVYPNPCRVYMGERFITFRNISSGDVIKVYDISGKLVHNSGNITSNAYRWSVGNVSSGVYFYKIEGKDKSEGKIVIIR